MFLNHRIFLVYIFSVILLSGCQFPFPSDVPAPQALSIFVPLQDESLTSLKGKFDDDVGFVVTNNINDNDHMDAWFTPKASEAISNTSTLVDDLTELSSGDWMIAQLTDNDASNIWSVGLLNTGDDERLEKLLQAVEVLILEIPKEPLARIPDDALFDEIRTLSYEIDHQGYTLPLTPTCPTCYTIFSECIPCWYKGQLYWCAPPPS